MGLPCFSPTLVLIILLSISQSTLGQTLRYECYARLEGADRDRDSKLDREEFTQAVNHMARGAFDAPDFMQLPGVMQQTFTSLSCRCLRNSGVDVAVSCCGGEEATVDIAGIVPGEHLTSVQEENLNEACNAIQDALDSLNLGKQGFGFLSSSEATADFPMFRQASSPAPTPSAQQCLIGMIVADKNPEDALMNKDEYVVFVNRLSNGAFGSTFESLPAVLQTNYNNLAQTSGQINIYGARPGVDPGTTQDLFLDQVCTDTGVAINTALAQVSPSPSTPSPSTSAPKPPSESLPSANLPSAILPTQPPTRSPTQGPPSSATLRPTIPINECYVGMIISDSPRNDQLDQTDYVTFVNVLQPGPFEGLTYDELPSTLQVNFDNLATNGSIDITGLPIPDDQQTVVLENICASTNQAITVALSPETPTTAPQQSATPIPTSISPSQSESRPPTKKPTQKPTTPVPTLSTTESPSSTPVVTPQPTTAKTPKPTTAATSQPTAVPSLAATPAATSQPTAVPSLAATPAPSLAKTPRPTPRPSPNPTGSSPSSTGRPTIAPDKVEVINQFIVSNTDGITATDLNDPTNVERGNLDIAYSSLVDTTIGNEFTGSNRYLRALRRLSVDYIEGATREYVDTPCPNGQASDALCQEVVASFFLNVSRDEDSKQVAIDAKIAVDDSIAAGNLQALLTEEGSALSVVEGADIADVPSAAPSLPVSGGFTGSIIIQSSFFISNTINLSAAGMQPGSTYGASLQAAYNATANGVVVGTDDTSVVFVGNSAAITSVVDAACPENALTGSVCQAVYAQYNISVVNRDETLTLAQYTEATNLAISDGTLQQNLDALDENNPISIEAGIPPTRAPTPGPTSVPAPDPIASGSGGLTTPVIIGIAVGGSVLILVCAAGVIFYRRSKGRPQLGRDGKVATSKENRFDDGLIDNDDSYRDYEGSRKGRNKDESSGKYDQYGALDDSEPNEEFKTTRRSSNRNEFGEDEDEDSQSDDYDSASDSESMSQDSRENLKDNDSFDSSTDLDDYEFDDPTAVVQQGAKATSGRSDYQPSSSDESESGSESASESGSESGANSPPQSHIESESSEENDDGWDDDDGTISDSDKAEEIEGNTSFTDLVADRSSDASTKAAAGTMLPAGATITTSGGTEDNGLPAGEAAAIGVAAGAAAAGAVALWSRKSKTKEDEDPARDSQTEYSSDDTDVDDDTFDESMERSGPAEKVPVAARAAIVEQGTGSDTESDSRSRSSASYSSRSRSSRSHSSRSHSSKSRSSGSYSSRSQSSGSYSSGSYTESDNDKVAQYSQPLLEEDSVAPVSPVALHDESESSYTSDSYTESEVDEPPRVDKTTVGTLSTTPAPVNNEEVATDKQHRSALDESESEIDESEYTDSDNGTYEEGTLDGDATLGTYDDTPLGDKRLSSEDQMAVTEGTGRKMPTSDESNSIESQGLGTTGIPDEVRRNSDVMDNMVKKGDWDGIIDHAGKVEKNLDAMDKVDAARERRDSASSGSRSGSDSRSRSGSSYSRSSYSESHSGSGSYTGSASGSKPRSEGSYSDAGSDTEDYTTEGASSAVDTSVTETPAELQRKHEVRAEVEALVRLVVPEEVDNIDAMLAQFKGREEELLQTLRTMQERSVTVRARAAVHKSSGRPPPRRADALGYRRDGAYSVDSRQTGESETSRGSAAGSAAIAAASIPRPATGRVPIHPPPVPAYESRRESDGSSPYSDPSKNSGSKLRSTNVGSQGNLRSPASGSESESESGSESGSYTSGSYTSSSRSASESGSYTGSSESRSESYTSGSLEDLPNRWKSDKQQPLSKRADDPSGDMKYDRHKVRGAGGKR